MLGALVIEFRNAAAALLIAAVALTGCVKHPAPPPPRPRPTPTPEVASEDSVDATADHMRRKTVEAAAAISNYLQANEPRLKGKFEKFGDKFSRDRNSWRKKLLAEKEQLQPQIDALKQKASALDPKARTAIDRETASLEEESRDADTKLTELESATADGWKEFRERLKAEDDARQNTPPTPVPSPTTAP
jgi:hypothetical protein